MAQAYWARLTPHFAEFVVGLSDPKRREELATEWLDRVVGAAQAAFQEAATTLGDEAATLRQRVQGENLCRARLFKARIDQR
jgi:hypothetical protein